MEKHETFKITYSARQREEIEKIRQKYLSREKDKMEQLRALDAGVEKKATAISLIAGILGALIMGIGMSMIMSDFGKPLGDLALPIGIGTGIVGIALMCFAYPMYLRLLRKGREKIAPEILRLSEELMHASGSTAHTDTDL